MDSERSFEAAVTTPSLQLECIRNPHAKPEEDDSDSSSCGYSQKPSRTLLRRKFALRLKVSNPDEMEYDSDDDVEPAIQQAVITEIKPYLGDMQIKNIKDLKLHYPENSEKLMRYLKSGEYELLERDQNGYTPLHAIVGSGHSDKMACLFVLMVHSEYGTELIDIPGGRNGETALHTAVQLADVETMKVLLSFGADIDALDFTKRTSLDIITEKKEDKRYEAVSTLLTSLDAKSGLVTIAKKKGRPAPAAHKRLWSLSAHLPELQEEIERPVIASNHRNSVSLDEYMSAAEVAQKLEKFLTEEYTKYNDIWDHSYQVALGLQQFELQGWKTTSNPAIQFQIEGGSRILCLDGGGMRGLIQIEILSAIERCTGRKIIDLFDWIIGTSTGGIVALGLVYGKKSVSELRQVYFRLKEEIFAKSGFGIGYNTEALEAILKENFEENMRMSDIREPKVLVSAVLKKTTNLHLTFFNNCFNDEFSNELVWKVARYTSAAPMNFSECDSYVDGGVLANNPSDYGITAIQNYHREEGIKLSICCVISVGTGTFPASDLGSTDAHESIFHLLALKRRAVNLMTLITKALVESENVATNSRSRCTEQHIPFFRFSPNLDTQVQSGETNNNILIDMLVTTRYQIIEQWNEEFSDISLIFSRVQRYSVHKKKRRLRDKRQRHALRHGKKMMIIEDT